METIKIKITHGVTQKSEIITMEQAIDILEGLYTKNKVVKEKNINCSAVLVTALKDKLGIR